MLLGIFIFPFNTEKGEEKNKTYSTTQRQLKLPVLFLFCFLADFLKKRLDGCVESYTLSPFCHAVLFTVLKTCNKYVF